MKVLISAGDKTHNIIAGLGRKFNSGGIDFIGVERIDDIDDIYQRGEYFDKALIIFNCWSEDGLITNTARTKVNDFAKAASHRGINNASFIFLAADIDAADAVYEEMLPISAQSSVIVKEPPYNVSFFSDLITKPISSLSDGMVYTPNMCANTPVETGTSYIEDDDTSELLSYTPEYTDDITDGLFDDELADGDGFDFEDDFGDFPDGNSEFGDENPVEPEVTKVGQRGLEYYMGQTGDEEVDFGDWPDIPDDEQETGGLYQGLFGVTSSSSSSSSASSSQSQTQTLSDLNKSNQVSSEASQAGVSQEQGYQEQVLSRQYTSASSTSTSTDRQAMFEKGASTNTPVTPITQVNSLSGQGQNQVNQASSVGNQDMFEKDAYTKNPVTQVNSLSGEEQNQTMQYQGGDWTSADSGDWSSADSGDWASVESGDTQDQYTQDQYTQDQYSQDQYNTWSDGDNSSDIGYQGFDESEYEQQEYKPSLDDYNQRPVRNEYNSEYEDSSDDEPKAKHSLSGAQIKATLDAFANRGNSILITGFGGCGTSTVALNLANIINNLGYTVLLVDLDTENKTQSYISKDNYDSVDMESTGLMAAINSSSGINAHVSIVRQGFHLLTMGMSSDSTDIEKIIHKEKINRFINMAKTSHNFVIYDCPFKTAVGFGKDITFMADNIVLTIDCSNWGISKAMLQVCNVADDDMQETLFNRGQILFNRCKDLKKVMGKKFKTAVDITKIMDNKVHELLGEDPGFYFQSMHICGLLKEDKRFESGWYNDIQYSDSKDGSDNFLEILKSIVMKQ